MSAKRILVLSSLHLCRNPRVVKEAGALAAAGHAVTVMTVSASERFAKMDRELMRTQRFELATLDLTGASPAQRARSFFSRGSTWLARAALKHLRVESPQALGPARELRAMARAFPADLVIAHTEIPIWAAEQLIRAGRRVAVDIEDWYSEDLLVADRRSRPLRHLRRAEKFALTHAAYASTTSDSMAAALAEEFGCATPIVIRNTFPLQPRTRLDRPAEAVAPAFIWFSQTVGPGRGLEAFLAAWSRTTQRSRVCLLGEVRPDFRQHLLERVPPGHRDDLVFLPLVPPEELPDQLCEFDIGLALEPHEPRNKDLTTSNKIFHYLVAGLAVVATDTAGQSEVMRAAPASGLLVQAQDTSRLASQLDGLLASPAQLQACQRAARAAAVAEFCWEKDAARLLAAVARALA